jgi:hypothetical protein
MQKWSTEAGGREEETIGVRRAGHFASLSMRREEGKLHERRSVRVTDTTMEDRSMPSCGLAVIQDALEKV